MQKRQVVGGLYVLILRYYEWQEGSITVRSRAKVLKWEIRNNGQAIVQHNTQVSNFIEVNQLM